MNSQRFRAVTKEYRNMKVAVVGDFCLDRYLEIDPARQEVSIETGLGVHNVVNIRSQPGAAGTVLNNLVALGVGKTFPLGFCGEDGEGMELQRALRAVPGVSLEYFFSTPERRTLTYTKPLVLRPGRPPRELNRLDIKNWTPTPVPLQRRIVRALQILASRVDALIVMEQVEVQGTGVVTREVLQALKAVSRMRPKLTVVADSRRGLGDFPPCIFKMNADELAHLAGERRFRTVTGIRKFASALAQRNQQPVFVTLAEAGAIAAISSGEVVHVPALPVRGPIDIVGAGDAVTANLTAALAAGAMPKEALELAGAAASIVIHQLGRTGTASVRQIRSLLVR